MSGHEVLCQRHRALARPFTLARAVAYRRKGDPALQFHAEVTAVAQALLELWSLAFPVPPEHQASAGYHPSQGLGCKCPMCIEAWCTAVVAVDGRAPVSPPRDSVEAPPSTA